MSDLAFEAMRERFLHMKYEPLKPKRMIVEDALRYGWDAAIEYKADASESARLSGDPKYGKPCPPCPPEEVAAGTCYCREAVAASGEFSAGARR